jgi:hypothetical protein
VSITNCYNTGNIENPGKQTVTNGSTPTQAAGIVGMMVQTSNVIITNCYSNALHSANYGNAGEIYSTGTPSGNGISVCKTSSAYVELADGSVVLAWQLAYPGYEVSFIGGNATIDGETADEFVLARGHYEYTGGNGAVGEFWVTRGGKTIALSADVTFTNLTEQGAAVSVKRGDTPVTAATPGVYEDLPNGEYTYEITVDNVIQIESGGTFSVVGVDREIAVESLAPRVAVAFDVQDADGNEVENPQITVRRSSDNGVVSPTATDSSTYLLYPGETYTYTVTALYFNSVPGSITVGGSAADIPVELTRLTTFVVFTTNLEVVGAQTQLSEMTLWKSGTSAIIPYSVVLGYK